MLSTRMFLIILSVVIAGGIIYTGYSFFNLNQLKNSNEYLSQIQNYQYKILKEKRKIEYIRTHYKKNPNISTLEYYMALVKQFKYLVKGTTEISNFSLEFIKNKKNFRNYHNKKGKLNYGINLLTKYLTPYKGNKYIKSLSLITKFQLSNAKNIDPNNDTINFFKLYKPLIYLYYLKENKPIIIKNVKYSNNTYNIYMQILGK